LRVAFDRADVGLSRAALRIALSTRTQLNYYRSLINRASVDGWLVLVSEMFKQVLRALLSSQSSVLILHAQRKKPLMAYGLKAFEVDMRAGGRYRKGVTGRMKARATTYSSSSAELGRKRQMPVGQ
jgi:hypothetical protein